MHTTASSLCLIPLIKVDVTAICFRGPSPNTHTRNCHENIGRQIEVARGRAFANPSSSIVLRAMTPKPAGWNTPETHNSRSFKNVDDFGVST